MYFDKIVFTDNYIDCDVFIGHITDEIAFEANNKDVIGILISGEPYRSKYRFDISIDTKFTSNAIKTIYYPFIFSSLHERCKSYDFLNNYADKNKFCAYMYHISYEHRIKYFELLSKYKKVDALGKCCNNVKITNTRDRYDSELTYNDIAIDYYSHYKFVLAIENTLLKGYSTEKLLNPLIANSIPIYWGDDEIFKYINKTRVVYIPDFRTSDDLLKHIEYLDTNKEAYNNIISENIFVGDFTIKNFETELCRNIGKELKFIK